ncbi:ATP-binding protein [Aquabacterium sp.]|uniref:ATP-binding protein n=1 Tax=Aquabacterium sp. TaxID=1872578 RepID=UPI002B56AB32|nr:ATP-binding protein [Aquabacterium sp.]HSW09041.1 ATP-binding protein [Aquabacterium sp.]
MNQRVTPWFGVTGLLLLATLLAAAFVQVRQYALLNLTVQNQNDYLVLSLYQLETEYLRLREQWRMDLDTAAGNPAPLQLRYDIFLSRAALLRAERAQQLIGRVPNAQQVLRQIDSFSSRADLYLSSEPRGPLSPQAARALLADLIGLGDPIHQLLLDATHQVASQVTERQDKVRQHNEIGLGLTGFLSAMVLVFALIALRQMRKLEQRRQHLETLADQLRDARIEAESASNAKSEFLADMSHELRTPLHGLLGMLSLLKEAPGDPQAGDWLTTADESATHLLHLLDDILDLSKLESGALALQTRSVALRGLVNEVHALMQPQAQAKGLTLELRYDESLPSHVRLDPTRMRQVLFNLLNNAIKFSDHGSVILRCAQVAGPEGAPQLEFDVSDTGIGMDPHTVSRLFQRFARADDPRARRQGGTGLGLAISRNLARLMGGEIVVRSTPGAGSVFSFRSALVPDAPPADETGPAASAGSATADGSATAPAAGPVPPPLAPPQDGLRVLVAEDHPVNRMYLAALLERLGHHGHHVTNGLEAVQAMRERSFDLVLMDVHMPVMDGVAASEAIRSLPAPASRVRIIALTADVFAETRERCMAAGVDEVITKPVSLPALTTLLSQQFGLPAAAVPAGAHAVAHVGAAAAPGSPPREAMLIDHAALADVTELMGAGRSPALYGGFFEQASDTARRMREAMRDADTESLRRAAHAVKGAALNLGLPALADAAATLNRDGSTLSAAQLALAVQRYEELVNATRSLCAAEGLISE